MNFAEMRKRYNKTKDLQNVAQMQFRDLTESSQEMLYGCTGLFDLCSDADLMSLTLQGASPLLDWLGWSQVDVCKRVKNFMTYVRPNYVGDPIAAATPGWIADPCADRNTYEWDSTDFTISGFGRLSRTGPVRDITDYAKKLCENQQRFRLDGSPINNDRELEMLLATEVLLQDFKRLIVTGTDATGGQFDGLQQLVKAGYLDSSAVAQPLMDSIVVDWNNNGIAGGAGITWNGVAVAATFSLISVILSVYRRIRQRISWSPTLNAAPPMVGDMILVMPAEYAPVVLDAYAAWRFEASVGTQYNENVINNTEVRAFRESLNGGMFGAGTIYLDGMEIPIMPYDWELINADGSCDMYFLTGSVRSTKLFYGENLDMRKAVAAISKDPRMANYGYTDGGRLLTWTETDNTCAKTAMELQPRLVCPAPWAQARISTVEPALVTAAISPDPESASWPG